MKKGVGSKIGSGAVVESISQRYGSGDPEPDPHQKVTDPQLMGKSTFTILILKLSNEMRDKKYIRTQGFKFCNGGEKKAEV